MQEKYNNSRRYYFSEVYIITSFNFEIFIFLHYIYYRILKLKEDIIINNIFRLLTFEYTSYSDFKTLLLSYFKEDEFNELYNEVVSKIQRLYYLIKKYIYIIDKLTIILKDIFYFIFKVILFVFNKKYHEKRLKKHF